jgi:hypothetical protein
MDKSTFGVLCIVLFVVYPFAMAGLASAISSRTSSRQYRNKFAAFFTCIGLVPVVFLVIESVKVKVPSVPIVAAIVLVLCLFSTGAVMGAIIDRAKEANESDQQQQDSPR